MWAEGRSTGSLVLGPRERQCLLALGLEISGGAGGVVLQKVVVDEGLKSRGGVRSDDSGRAL